MSASPIEPAPVRDVLVLPDMGIADDIARVVGAAHVHAPEVMALGCFAWRMSTRAGHYRWLTPYKIEEVRAHGYLGRFTAALRPDLALVAIPSGGGRLETGDLRAVREAGVGRFVLLVEDDGDAGALATSVRAQAREAGFADDSAPLISMRLRRAMLHGDHKDPVDELEDEDVEEFEPGSFGFSQRYLDRCVGWVRDLEDALDALPALRTTSPEAWPVLAPSASFACRACGVALTPPLAEARLRVTGRQQVVRGMYFDVAREDAYVRPGQILVHPDDLVKVRFSADTRGGGGYRCPGELPNLECPDGHRCGVGFSGGAQADVFALDPALVRRLPIS